MSNLIQRRVARSLASVCILYYYYYHSFFFMCKKYIQSWRQVGYKDYLKVWIRWERRNSKCHKTETISHFIVVIVDDNRASLYVFRPSLYINSCLFMKWPSFVVLIGHPRRMPRVCHARDIHMYIVFIFLCIARLFLCI